MFGEPWPCGFQITFSVGRRVLGQVDADPRQAEAAGATCSRVAAGPPCAIRYTRANAFLNIARRVRGALRAGRSAVNAQ